MYLVAGAPFPAPGIEETIQIEDDGIAHKEDCKCEEGAEMACHAYYRALAEANLLERN